MADPYRTTNHRSLEPDDMSSFLQNLIHGSSASADSGGLFPRPVTDLMGRMRGGASAHVLESSPCMNFLDPSVFYASELNESDVNAFSPAEIDDFEGAGSSKRTDFPYENKDCETSYAPSNLAQPRSSKRSRSAEVHNLSEKRRRSRINEKLKALQTLIPNSNKTDKASMLDKAIDYLKQLQLQVQMLSMRNGLGLYPGYFHGGSLQSGVEYDKGNPAAAFSGNQEMLLQTNFHMSNKNSTAQHTMPSMKNSTSNAEIPAVLETSIHNHYGHLNQFSSTKDLCRDNALSRLHLDRSCSGNNSSPGISS